MSFDGSKLIGSNLQIYKINDADCENLALKAEKFGMSAIIVAPVSLIPVERVLDDKSNVEVIAAVAFPSGAYTAKVKVAEIEDLKTSGLKYDSIAAVTTMCTYLTGDAKGLEKEAADIIKAAGEKTPVYFIIEAGYLNDCQMKEVCDIFAKAGGKGVIASTGFWPYDLTYPTTKDIKALASAAKGRLEIIACGDINTASEAREMIDAGADRVISTKTFEIIKE